MDKSFTQLAFETGVRTLENPTTKIVTGVPLAWIAFFVDPEHYLLLGSLLALVVIDNITGVYASKLEGNRFQSRRLRITVAKIIGYFLVISAGYLMENILPITYIDDIIIAYAMATEFLSIIENSDRAGLPVPPILIRIIKEKKDKFR